MRQRSRVPWLRDGDRNTKYFQAQATQRRRVNRISGLRHRDGTICNSDDEDKGEVQIFYQELYLTQGFNDMSALMQFVPARVTPEMNDSITKPYTPEEVRAALFQMAPSKAPGVDGFTAGFFQRHWHTVKDDLVPAILDFLHGGELPEGFNDTSITLIPKVRHPQQISQYRPIALCPVAYKIAAKMITNRLKEWMNIIVSEEQSTFVPGRIITDNVLVAFESVHTMRRRKSGKNFSCAVKLDMMKAFDRMEWHYLEAIMIRLGFNINFVQLIIKCVSSVRFAVRVNGELLPFFTPSKGLRQGCPMSPFLFLLCAEGLTSLLNYCGSFVDRGVRASSTSPWINHLLFADDCLIFISAKGESADRLNEILNIYATCSGQCVNKEKSAVYFTPNTPEARKHELKQRLGVFSKAFSDKYLGLPTAVGRITSGTFEHICDRVRSKMFGYSERDFACAGREVLLKSVIQAITTFSMSCFRLTKKVFKKLTSCMARYFWSSNIDRRSMNWVSWKKLASPKET